jgi:hypothetical protein
MPVINKLREELFLLAHGFGAFGVRLSGSVISGL